MFIPIVMVLLSLFANVVDAASVVRQSKSFGGTSFIDGVIPTAADFNGDLDTIFAEFNGNIDNANLKASAAIAATKINPDGFTTNIRTVTTAPCTVLDESDQSADAKRWAMCIVGGVLKFSTYSDANALQNTWMQVARADGSLTLGSTGGTNTINGPTTFNQLVTFSGSTTLTPTGMVAMYLGTAAPSGWVLMNGASHSCTGASAVNAPLCSLLVALGPSIGQTFQGGSVTAITADASSNEIVSTAHGKSVGTWMSFSTSITLPAPIVNTLTYCIKSVTTDRYKISTICGGAELDITTAGSGTHLVHYNFTVPDSMGRASIGAGAGAGLTSQTLLNSGGSEDAIVVEHTHTVTDPGHDHTVSSDSAPVGGTAATAGRAATADGTLTSSASVTGVTIEPTGVSAAGANMQPFFAITFIIKL